jgi:hypothetical protein
MLALAACGDDSSVTQRDGGGVGSDAGPRADGAIGRDAEAPGSDSGVDGGMPRGDGFPSIYPLELVLPRAAGTSPAEGTRGVGLEPGSPYPSIPATHRIFKAYPGIEYDIRAAVIGGSYPYSFALRDAPSGMTIDPSTGEIRWPSPDADATPTIVVTDMEGTEVSSPWSIDVTTEGFRFVDAASGNHYPEGTGTIDDPYRDFVDLRDDPAAVYGDVVYFRAGEYTLDGIERDGVGGAWEGIDFAEEDPLTFLEYPGERAILDFGFVAGADRAAVFRVSGAYIDGLETRNARNIGFQLGGQNFNVLRRLDMHTHNPGGEDLDGQNPAHIMSIDSEKWYTVVQDCDFHDAPTSGALKLYNEGKILIEDNLFHDMDGGVDWKVGVERGTFRGNRLWNLTHVGIYGNMNTRYEMYVRNGEICYNLFRTPEIVDESWDSGAVGLNWDGLAGRLDVYRNTILGRAYVARADAEDGPFHWSRNVIVNDTAGTPGDSGIALIDVPDPTRVVLDDNLRGSTADGIVDAEGNLTDAYDAYRGTHGYETRF